MPQNSRNNILRDKQITNNLPLKILQKCLRKGKNRIIALCQKKKKKKKNVECIYLAFQKLKIRSKKSQQLSES